MSDEAVAVTIVAFGRDGMLVMRKGKEFFVPQDTNYVSDKSSVTQGDTIEVEEYELIAV